MHSTLTKIKTGFSLWIPVCIIIIGAGLRAREYFINRSLWLDEALLALNIIDRGFWGLFQPLEYAQGAPIGFLVVEKILSKLLGHSEYVLRLFPFLCGVASLFLFYKLATTYLSKIAALLGLTLFAVCEKLIYYSAETKQYSSDVFWTMLIWFLSISLFNAEFATPWLIAYALMGSISIWFSHPAVFILAGTGLTLWFFVLRKKQKTAIIKLLAVFLLWGINFGLIYFISLRNLTQNQALLAYWQGAFAPFPPKSIGDIIWFYNNLISVLKDLVGSTLPELFALALVIGCITLYRRNKVYSALLFSPIIFLLIASFLHVYPLNGRLILFLVPIILLLVSEGAESITLGIKGLTNHQIVRFTRYIPLYIILLYPLINVYAIWNSPRTVEETRPAISFIKSNWQPGDKIYLYYASAPAFSYYAPQFGFKPEDTIIGISARDDPSKYIQQLAEIKDQKRVWTLFSHIFDSEADQMINYLDTRGKQLKSGEYNNAFVYLFDLDLAPK
jgi:Dolichyl-phosphate-mannose-protein mannosyltransferase